MANKFHPCIFLAGPFIRGMKIESVGERPGSLKEGLVRKMITCALLFSLAACAASSDEAETGDFEQGLLESIVDKKTGVINDFSGTPADAFPNSPLLQFHQDNLMKTNQCSGTLDLCSDNQPAIWRYVSSGAQDEIFACLTENRDKLWGAIVEFDDMSDAITLNSTDPFDRQNRKNSTYIYENLRPPFTKSPVKIDERNNADQRFEANREDIIRNCLDNWNNIKYAANHAIYNYPGNISFNEEGYPSLTYLRGASFEHTDWYGNFNEEPRNDSGFPRNLSEVEKSDFQNFILQKFKNPVQLDDRYDQYLGWTLHRYQIEKAWIDCFNQSVHVVESKPWYKDPFVESGLLNHPESKSYENRSIDYQKKETIIKFSASHAPYKNFQVLISAVCGRQKTTNFYDHISGPNKKSATELGARMFQVGPKFKDSEGGRIFISDPHELTGQFIRGIIWGDSDTLIKRGQFRTFWFSHIDRPVVPHSTGYPPSTAEAIRVGNGKSRIILDCEKRKFKYIVNNYDKNRSAKSDNEWRPVREGTIEYNLMYGDAAAEPLSISRSTARSDKGDISSIVARSVCDL